MKIPNCPFQIGQKVRVKGDNAPDWPDEYIVVSLQWRYAHGNGYDIGIASEDDITSHYGWTDGFSVDDLEPASFASMTEDHR